MYIEIPQVRKCCCKIPLKVGSLLAGLFNEVKGVVVICSSVSLINSSQYQLQAAVTNILIFAHYSGLMFSLLFGICAVFSSSLLLAALFKDRYSYILPFFAVQLLDILMNVVGFFTSFVCMFSNILMNFLFLVFFLLNGGLSFYCFIVVYSFYRDATWSSTVS